jgi:iron complex outermembrane receptor protein
LESYKAGSALTLQFGGRYEFQSIRLGEVDPLLPAYPGYAATTGDKRTDHGFSLSAGAVCYPAKDYSLGLSLAYTQRLPVAQEIFSNGPHGGTGAYEIGTANLARETSLGVDLTLRKRAGFVTGSVGVYVNKIQGFVFEQKDLVRYFDQNTASFRPYPVPPGDAFLPIYQFTAKDAVFYGAEAELSVHLIDTEAHRLHLDLSGDSVHAQQTTDDEPLPRIPPVRAGAALRYTAGPWSLGVSARHSFRQDRIAPGETPTAGYTLAGADVSYHFSRGPQEWEIFLRGSNLGNAEARASTSFLKDIAPLPGRSLAAGVRLTF